MLLLSPYGYVSRWGVRFWFQNRYFKGKYGYLSLRHSHMCTFFNVWNLAGLLSFWIYIYIHFETCTCFFSSTSFSLTRSPLRRPGSADIPDLLFDAVFMAWFSLFLGRANGCTALEHNQLCQRLCTTDRHCLAERLVLNRLLCELPASMKTLQNFRNFTKCSLLIQLS